MKGNRKRANGLRLPDSRLHLRQYGCLSADPLDLLSFEDIRKNMVYLLKNDPNVDPESVERLAIDTTRDVRDFVEYSL